MAEMLNENAEVTALEYDDAAIAAAEAEKKAAAPSADEWICSCGAKVSGKFCSECGAKRPVSMGEWICPSCGKSVSGKFCSECGAKRPEAKSWFCSECGKENEGKFCSGCGKKRD